MQLTVLRSFLKSSEATAPAQGISKSPTDVSRSFVYPHLLCLSAQQKGGIMAGYSRAKQTEDDICRIHVVKFCGAAKFALLLPLAASILYAQPTPPIQQLMFNPYHASGLYDVGDRVGWIVVPGRTAPTYAYKWTLRRNNKDVLKEGKLDLSSGKDRIEIVADRPEMIYVAIEPYASLSGEKVEKNQDSSTTPNAGQAATPAFVGGNTGRNNGFYAVGAAVAPSKLGLSTPRPPDFDAFWEAKLAAQAKVPLNPNITPVPSDIPGIEESMFALDAMGSKVHGYIAKPARQGQFPAIIQLQYAGIYALNPNWAAQRAADGWLVLNVDAHDKLPSDPSGNTPKAYVTVGNTDREKSYFLNMYLRDSRALDYLLTHPDWDRKTIVLIGGSQGGQQSFALAGLRPEKITAVLVCVPAGADTNGDLHDRKSGFPNWPSENPKAMETALYFDPVNFASRIKAPVMAGMGYIDTVSPPAGVWTVLNQISGPTEPLPLIESEHDNFTPEKGRACPARTQQILDSLRTGAQYKPTVLK
jgi:cephalosporin-C deacetylase